MEFKDPPEDAVRTRSSMIDDEVAKLKAQPGQWALVREGASSASLNIVYKARGCEVTTRARPDGKTDIYARWPA